MKWKPDQFFSSTNIREYNFEKINKNTWYNHKYTYKLSFQKPIEYISNHK